MKFPFVRRSTHERIVTEQEWTWDRRIEVVNGLSAQRRDEIAKLKAKLHEEVLGRLSAQDTVRILTRALYDRGVDVAWYLRMVK